MDSHIEHIAIGSGQARHVLEKIGPGSLPIVQGDRQDIIHAVIAANETQKQLNQEPGLLDRLRNRARFGRQPDDPEARLLAGIVFTNDRWPVDRDVEALRRAGIFALLVPDEIYPVASQLHSLLIKTHVQDRAKIETIKQVVAEHFDVDALLQRLDAPTYPTGTQWGAVERAGNGAAGPGGLVRRGLGRLAGEAAAGELLVSIEAGSAADIEDTGLDHRTLEVRGRTEPVEVVVLPISGEPAGR